MKFVIFVTTAAFFATTAAVCPTEWTPYDGSCYRFVNQYRQRWAEADAECQSAAPDKDSHLVVIDSEMENQWVHDWWVSMLSPLSGTGFEYIWLGYTDASAEGDFVWVTGSTSSYINWGGRQPDKGTEANCATMVTKYANDPGKWDDGKCVAKRAYVCEYRDV